jgi:hypothetical protein
MQTFALININYPAGYANTDGIYFVLLRQSNKMRNSL